MKWAAYLIVISIFGFSTFPVQADGADWSDVTEHHQASLVSLFSDHQQIGNGIILDGQVLVTERTTRTPNRLLARTSEGMWYRLRLLGKDPISNLALLQFIQPKGHKAPKGNLSLQQDLPISAGQQTAILQQYPNGIVRHQTSLVRNQDRRFDWGPHDSYIEVLDNLNQDSRGAALIDQAGNLAGIFTAMQSTGQQNSARGLFIPAKTISYVLSQLKQYGRVKRGWLGVRISNLSRLQSQELGLRYPQGLAVDYVNKASPAAQAGFQEGDIMLAFNHAQLSEVRDLAGLIASSRTGIPYPFQILRDGSQMTLTAVLQERLRTPLTP